MGTIAFNAPDQLEGPVPLLRNWPPVYLFFVWQSVQTP